MHYADKVVPLFGNQNPDVGRWPTQDEVMRKFNFLRLDLMRLALWATNDSYSWRGIRYGAAALLCRQAETEEERFGISWGANFTLTRRPKWRAKLCAEVGAAYMAQGAGFPLTPRTLGGVVVFSDNMQPDDHSKVWVDTQHCCFECRRDVLDPLMPWWAPALSFRTQRPCDLIDVSVRPKPRVLEVLDGISYVVEQQTKRALFELHRQIPQF